MIAAPMAAAALAAAAVFTSTAHVEALATDGQLLWAATSGGIEEREARTGALRRLYTTENGLDSNDVRAISVSAGAGLHARTRRAECALAAGRFTCVPATPLDAPAPTIAPLFHGLRETARLVAGGKTYVGTAGGGIWSNDQELPRGGTLCGNHVEALAEFRGALWVGTFDSGVCAYDGARFHAVAAPFRMVNDLRVTARGLYVAAAEGLFLTKDGRTFRAERRIRERGANRLALSGDGRWLFATTPASLYALRVDGKDVVRRWWRPGGSTAVQSVAVSGRDVWLATEDRGAIRMRHERFDTFDLLAGLPSSWAIDVAPAPDGGVYVGTLRHGLAHVTPKGAVERVDGVDPWGLRLVRDGDALLVGTQGGAFRVAPGQMTKETVALPDPNVHAFLRTAGGLWIGTEGGLVRVDEGAAVAAGERR